MKFKSLIKSNHDFKKNGYIIIRKLHKLEKKKNLNYVYTAICQEGFFFVLSCKNLIELIEKEYTGKIQEEKFYNFRRKSELFLNHLEYISINKTKINKKILSSYLKTYTTFFNEIIDDDIKFTINNSILSEWNLRCIMPYIAVWNTK